jgi:hypothetical protein
MIRDDDFLVVFLKLGVGVVALAFKTRQLGLPKTVPFHPSFLSFGQPDCALLLERIDCSFQPNPEINSDASIIGKW